jgi:hypothetical protein
MLQKYQANSRPNATSNEDTDAEAHRELSAGPNLIDAQGAQALNKRRLKAKK